MGAGGGDPTMQNLAYLCKYLEQHKLTRMCSLRLPVFLISIVGPLMAIYGAVVYGGKIHCDPLTPYLHLLPLVDDRKGMHLLGRVFRSLKICILHLRHYYEELFAHHSGQILPPVDSIQPFPYMNCFRTEDGDTLELEYKEQLGPHVYTANTSDRRKVVVKFSQIVSSEDAVKRGQNAVAPLGLAPALLAVGHCKPNWTITVSDYLYNTSPYQSTPARDENLRRAVQCLHDTSIVHGDIRANNVLVTEGSDLVHLIDFEFCGFEGVNKYPAFLNHTDVN